MHTHNMLFRGAPLRACPSTCTRASMCTRRRVSSSTTVVHPSSSRPRLGRGPFVKYPSACVLLRARELSSILMRASSPPSPPGARDSPAPISTDRSHSSVRKELKHRLCSFTISRRARPPPRARSNACFVRGSKAPGHSPPLRWVQWAPVRLASFRRLH
jgi:hypothetical protein